MSQSLQSNAVAGVGRRCSAILFALLASALVVLGSPSSAHAQEGSFAGEYSMFLGHMLPNQIEGVTEIMPMFGGRYTLASQIGGLEIGFMNTHSYGVDFTTFEGSLRGNINLGDGLEGIIYGGLDFNYYTRVNETSRRNETGLHMGAGGMMLVADTLWLRADLKFMGGPGTALFLLFGIAFRDGEAQ